MESLSQDRQKELKTGRAKERIPELTKATGEFDVDDIRNLEQASQILDNLKLEVSNFGSATGFAKLDDAKKYIENILKKRLGTEEETE